MWAWGPTWNGGRQSHRALRPTTRRSTRRTSCSDYANDHVGKLAGLLSDAQVEPKPHRIDAALFALQTPFLPGVILADEVGLGKTIEAGIVISKY